MGLARLSTDVVLRTQGDFRMRRLPILAAIAALSVSTTAHAEQWWVVAMDTSKGIVIEKDSMMTAPSGARRVWSALILADPDPDVDSEDVYIMRALNELDCGQRRLRRLQVSFLNKDFKRQHETDIAGDWQFVAPGTVANVIVEAACNGFDNLEKGGPHNSLPDAVAYYFDWWIEQ